MALYPAAVWRPLPQNQTQAKIAPTQVILHSTTAPDDNGTWVFFAHGSAGAGTESHFLVDYDGSVIQAMDTTVRADAQFDGNTHGISIETASNPKASDAWTPAQAAAIVALGKWLLIVHPAIGRRECRTESDPGFGYHRLFTAWNYNGHSCPGDLRVKQFPMLLAQILAPAPDVSTPEVRVFLFTATLPGKAAAWYLTDGVAVFRRVDSDEKAAYVKAGVQTVPLPTNLAKMTNTGTV